MAGLCTEQERQQWESLSLLGEITRQYCCFLSRSTSGLEVRAQVGFSQQCPDALARRSACAALSQLARAGARLPDSRLRATHEALTGALVAPGLPEAGWYGVAEAAVSALYAVHPQPAQLCEAVLRSMAKSAMAAIGEGEASPYLKCDSDAGEGDSLGYSGHLQDDRLMISSHLTLRDSYCAHGGGWQN